jgi:hypothetical protein
LADEAARRDARSRASARDRLFTPSLVDVYLAAMTSAPSNEVLEMLSVDATASM